MTEMMDRSGQSDQMRYPLLSRVTTPADLSAFTSAQLVGLAQEIRAYLIESIAKTGGHLGPNLGIVEVTLAIHRVFESPRDTIIWDTGHQAYIHKLLTGRRDFSNLRRQGGLSGYPSRAESDHDVVENSHATTALSWADGVSKEKQRMGVPGTTVAVIGDGALTGGMAWEALNNIAQDPRRPLVIVMNDNGRSYDPTIGGLAKILDAMRTSQGYEETLRRGKSTLLGLGTMGKRTYGALHGLKAGLKDVFAPQAMFGDLGLKYIGPVDGHDEVALELALERAKSFGEAVIVHAITEKGRGYSPAEEDIADRFHAVGVIHPETGLPVAPARFGWTKIFAEHLLKSAEKDPRIIGVTAAMMAPVGLQPLATRFPGRVIDVGIAEQHGFTSAAGMAFEGAHPVVCVYATFMNRAFDQLLMDIALHREPVTVVLDRAGITGDDGASHNGMWDLSLAAMVPGLRVAAPRDGKSLREELTEALQDQSGPTLLRYPKGQPPADIPALRAAAGGDVVFERSELDLPEGEAAASILIVAAGSMVPAAIEAAKRLVHEGYPVTVVDPRWVLPVRDELVELAKQFDTVVSVEDGIEVGGMGSELSRLSTRAGGPPVHVLGVPRNFFQHASRASIIEEIGLDAEGIYQSAHRAGAMVLGVNGRRPKAQGKTSRMA
ncbi:1-deoxy-D-xylulose-5-phosphate synthase [Actinomyces minihominis]|uniref:1-deoxy-D-xylulose-5-phosphate synthase n=1 Tax=Actinomyces minihominis TaxID=2002838 RepID=UPI001F5C9A80|nr:1-deoxy-D-xylulose-5-phosphate synthase [Actinomyces minihominis]